MAIIDVPTADDFRETGLGFFNIAWDIVLRLADDLAFDPATKSDPEAASAYWRAAQKSLGIALALVQQGTEFLLKAGIAKQSPYLLIAGDPATWPKHCHKQDMSFAAFQTIDAHELVRAFNTVAAQRLSDAFIEAYHKLRGARNTVMHTVDASRTYTPKEVLEIILEFADVLVAPRQWVILREAYLESQPASVAYSDDHVRETLLNEFLHVIELLDPALLKKYFEFDKKARRYYCSDCQSFMQVSMAKTAQLKPKAPGATTVRCFICGAEESIVRNRCSNSNCAGDVMTQDGTCLTCYN